MSKIEEIISEIEDYLDSCRYARLSSTNILVNRDEIGELVTELRLKTPEEIKKYKRIIANKDAILRDAKMKADAMIAQAEEQTSELVSEHEIMQQAYAQADAIIEQANVQAQDMLDAATEEANAVRTGAMQYTDDVLQNLENIITHTMDNVTMKYDALMKSLNSSLEVVSANRQELVAQNEEIRPDELQAVMEETVDENYDDLEDYTVDLDGVEDEDNEEEYEE